MPMRILTPTIAKWLGTIILVVIIGGGGYFTVNKWGSAARLGTAYDRIVDLERSNVACEIGRETLIKEIERLKGDIEVLRKKTEALQRDIDVSETNIENERLRLQRRIRELELEVIGESCEDSMNYLRDQAINRRIDDE